MKDRSLVIIDGFGNHYGEKEKHIFKILAILEENGTIFKGIGLSEHECDIDDYHSIILYLASLSRKNVGSSCEATQIPQVPAFLIAGYYDDSTIQYTNLIDNQKVTYGNFKWENGAFIGRERKYQGNGLKRDLDRLIIKYNAPLLVMNRSELYDWVEAALLFQRSNLTWQGIQCAYDGMVFAQKNRPYVLLPETSNPSVS